METLKKNIRQYRKDAGFTQGKLAEMLGTSKNSVSNWETGFNLPPLEHIVKMSKIFDISLDLFINGEDREHKKSGQNGIESIKSKNLFVPITAQAGYMEGWTNEELEKNLESINIPNVPADRESRTFEVAGSSMIPVVFAGDLLVCTKVERGTEFHGDVVYVVVTKFNGILVKHIELDKNANKIHLISNNKIDFATTTIPLDEVIEIWRSQLKVTRHLASATLNNINDETNRRINRLEQLLLDNFPLTDSK